MSSGSAPWGVEMICIPLIFTVVIVSRSGVFAGKKLNFDGLFTQNTLISAKFRENRLQKRHKPRHWW